MTTQLPADHPLPRTVEPVIAYDVMRLFIGPSYLTPRGIDRVDLALARHVFRDSGTANVGVLPTPAGVYVFSARQVRRLLSYVQRLWAEDVAAADDPQLRWLLDAVASGGAAASPPRVPALRLRHKVGRMVRMVGATRLLPHRRAVRAVPRGAVYINMGQMGLAMPSFFTWLAKRPDVACAVMVHDAIPVDFPQLVSENGTRHHRQMIATAGARADAVIFNSVYTQQSVSAVMAAAELACPPSLVRSLPLPDAFAAAGETAPVLAGVRYFIAVSTIEPRKNFGLLLALPAK